VRGPRTFQQFLAVDPELSQAIRHMSDLPVTTVVRAAKDLLARVATPAEVSAPEAAVEAAEPETSPWGEPIQDVDAASEEVEAETVAAAPLAPPAAKKAPARKRTAKRDAG
jgi:hypothetical protein